MDVKQEVHTRWVKQRQNGKGQVKVYEMGFRWISLKVDRGSFSSTLLWKFPLPLSRLTPDTTLFFYLDNGVCVSVQVQDSSSLHICWMCCPKPGMGGPRLHSQCESVKVCMCVLLDVCIYACVCVRACVCLWSAAPVTCTYRYPTRHLDSTSRLRHSYSPSLIL